MTRSYVYTVPDVDGRPIVGVYRSTDHGRRCYRFRILGGNNEIMAASQAYDSIKDAARGADDLRNRLAQLTEENNNE